MLICPACQHPLVRQKTAAGMVYQCKHCGGRAVALPVLRRALPRKLADVLWREARRNDRHRGKRCPACRRLTSEVAVPGSEGLVPIDVCTACNFVWFDPREFQQFPKAPPPPAVREMPEKAREALAMAELRRDELRHRDSNFGGTGPDDEWKVLPALLGMPVEYEVNALRHLPWFTWSLAMALAVVFAATYATLPAAVQRFGLIPAQLWRMGGLTLVTSFFLHASLLHLVGNVYFLLVFGDNVEDQLDVRHYGLLLLTATVAGGLLHALGDPRGLLPCVGASGGISGVIVYYALRFPEARLGILIRYFLFFRWLHFPAWSGLIIWVVWQALIAHQQLAGRSSVSALAHLGGAAVGFGAWLLWRRRGRSEQPDDPFHTAARGDA